MKSRCTKRRSFFVMRMINCSTRITTCILMLNLLINVHCLQGYEHQFRHHQDLSSDTSDTSPSSGDNYESDPSDLREDTLVPPNELSVIRLNDTSVVLRWEFPEEAQTNLLYFKVQYKSTRKNVTDWKTDMEEISAVTRAYQINSLRPGNFLFCVVAVYENQDNVLSKPLKYKIRAKTKIALGEFPEMTAPKIYWNESNTDYFRYKWKYEPKPNDTAYFGFLVYYRSKHIVSDFTIFNTMDTNVEIAELEPDTPYESKVVAYNMVGVSEFSDTITIRTKPAAPELSSSTTILAPESTVAPPIIIPNPTTRRPQIEVITTETPPKLPPGPHNNIIITTDKPTVPAANNGNSTTTTAWQSIKTFFEPIFTDQSDAMLTVRYLLIVLLPSLFVIFGLIFCIRPYRNKKHAPRPPSSTDDSQFDLEINGYFRNSFPGVETKEYPGVSIDGVHTGFVNNHPHINDFA